MLGVVILVWISIVALATVTAFAYAFTVFSDRSVRRTMNDIFDAFRVRLKSRRIIRKIERETAHALRMYRVIAQMRFGASSALRVYAGTNSGSTEFVAWTRDRLRDEDSQTFVIIPPPTERRVGDRPVWARLAEVRPCDACGSPAPREGAARPSSSKTYDIVLSDAGSTTDQPVRMFQGPTRGSGTYDVRTVCIYTVDVPG